MNVITANNHFLQKFELDGFVIVRNFLSGKDVEELLMFYESIKQNHNSGFHATSHVSSYDYRKSVNNQIKSRFEEKADQILNDYRSCFAAFTVKEPGESSVVKGHLDWSMVNEDEHVSVTIWTPLVKVDKDNGALWALKGSHKFGRTLRGGPWNYFYSRNGEMDFGDSKYKKETFDLNPGDAVIYDHRLVHGSYANLSKKTRVAINQTLVPRNVVSSHFFLNEVENRIERYNVEDEFYLKYQMGTKPHGTCVESIRIDGTFLTQEQVDALASE